MPRAQASFITRHVRSVSATVALLCALSAATGTSFAQQAASSLSGAVTQAGTGGTLQGVRVKIEETGVTTTTDSQGHYRFGNLAPGRYTVVFSYLGFPDYSQSIEVQGSTELSHGFEQVAQLEEAVVTGQRAGQAAALNMQRTADNTRNVVSADQAGRFPDINAAESLRRIPGVSVQREDVGGEGRYVSIRGLDSGLNSTTINGMNAAQPEVENRRVPLDMVQTSALATITVHKSLLPDQEADGVGGAVELTTATAFDFNKPVLDFTATGYYHDLADRTSPMLQFTGATRFGADDQFGVLVSAAWGKRHTLGNVFYQDEDYLAYTEDDPLSGVTPLMYHITEYRDTRENVSANLALNWQASDSTAFTFKGSFNRSFDKEDSRALYFEGGTDEYEDGELIRGEPGVAALFNQYEETELTQHSFTLAGTTLQGPFTYNYSLGYSEAVRKEPFDNEVAFEYELESDLFDYNFDGGRFPWPALTPGDEAGLADPANYELGYNDRDIDDMTNKRYAARFDAIYEPDSSWLRFVKGGVKIERSHRKLLEGNVMDLSGPLTLEEFGVGRLVDVSRSGAPYSPFLSLDSANVRNWVPYAENLIATRPDEFENGYVEDGGIPLDGDSYTNNEDTYDAYLMGKGVWGPWELVGGARIDHTRVKSDNWEVFELEDESPQYRKIVGKANYTNVLPRFQVNYRASDDLVFRGAFYTSIARPEPLYVSGATSVEEEDGEVDITVGNPGLKPAYSYNFDLGVERYFGSIGVISGGVYYKHIKRFIFSELGNESELDPAFFASDPRLADKEIDDVVTYTNGKAADIYGLELNIVRQFIELPGVWGGLGVYANATLQHSKADPGIEDMDKGDFFNAPEKIFTGAVTYQKYGVEGTLAYSWRDRQIRAFSSYNMPIVEESVGSVDLQLRYALAGNWKVFFNAADLFNSGKDPIIDERYGEHSQYLENATYTGRTFTFGVNYRF
jgi:TonB-dependent receptor